MANTDLAFVGSVPELYTRYMGPILFGAGPVEARMQAHVVTARRRATG